MSKVQPVVVAGSKKAAFGGLWSRAPKKPLLAATREELSRTQGGKQKLDKDRRRSLSWEHFIQPILTNGEWAAMLYAVAGGQVDHLVRHLASRTAACP
jgi:hypothetical protein